MKKHLNLLFLILTISILTSCSCKQPGSDGKKVSITHYSDTVVEEYEDIEIIQYSLNSHYCIFMHKGKKMSITGDFNITEEE